MEGMWVSSQGQEDPLEKEMATHTSILAWVVPWIEEAGGLQSMGQESATKQIILWKAENNKLTKFE